MKKIAVGILGATGMVGQKFVELLSSHPWFEITALASSSRSSGKRYCDAAPWRMLTPLPSHIAHMIVSPCEANLPCDIVFSGLDSSVAKEIEAEFASHGYTVISNARNHRLDPTVPLLIPEINSSHLELIKAQRFGKGAIITNPNCSVIGISMALKPLVDQWGIEHAHIVTLQALSGAGYPGVASMDILDNVIPHISGEEEKIETEPLKIFGTYHNGAVSPHSMRLSAHCTRVNVSDGHLACLSVKLNSSATREEIITAWNTFPSLKLPSAPLHPVIYLEDDNHPQPKLHRHLHKGMAVSIGRLRSCSLLDWKFVILSHNTIRGAAGCAILNAELLYKDHFQEKIAEISISSDSTIESYSV